ncbi:MULTISPECIES: ABC transporter permease [unclassified Mycoplasma]|uniref:ABC transporter permease n=1 Tax=unclassified Mycoplasma TaxID=2683645 RepID=UPI002B1E20DC|nr:MULTISPECIES: ABC transporter permease [unclassified Mycoplasma]MEA4162358.1 ABC transporter permease [Mycoplasma sp. 4404]MEA4276448.1 ABC transporter permease [Mycoplasma sp. 21DD0573]
MELIVSYAVFFFCILLLGSISGIFSERAGIVNIAINGFMIFGAIMYVMFSVILTDFIFHKEQTSMLWQIPLTLLSVGASALFALLFGLATIKLKSDQTISGFAMGLLATGIACILMLFILDIQKEGQTATYYGRSELALSSSLGEYQNIVSFKTFATLIIAFASWFALRKTKWGLRFRAIGENPQAADVAGINVNKIKWQAVILAGMVAGLAGTFYAQSFQGPFSITKDVEGLGFLALAIMIVSRWRISIAVVISLLFSIMISVSSFGVSYIKAEKYSELVKAVPYVITLFVMIFISKSSSGPAAAGIPYDKSKR